MVHPVATASSSSYVSTLHLLNFNLFFSCSEIAVYLIVLSRGRSSSITEVKEIVVVFTSVGLQSVLLVSSPLAGLRSNRKKKEARLSDVARNLSHRWTCWLSVAQMLILFDSVASNSSSCHFILLQLEFNRMESTCFVFFLTAFHRFSIISRHFQVAGKDFFICDVFPLFFSLVCKL